MPYQTYNTKTCEQRPLHHVQVSNEIIIIASFLHAYETSK